MKALPIKCLKKTPPHLLIFFCPIRFWTPGKKGTNPELCCHSWSGWKFRFKRWGLKGVEMGGDVAAAELSARRWTTLAAGGRGTDHHRPLLIIWDQSLYQCTPLRQSASIWWVHSSLVIIKQWLFSLFICRARKCKLRHRDIINSTLAPLISDHKSELISLHGSALVWKVVATLGKPCQCGERNKMRAVLCFAAYNWDCDSLVITINARQKGTWQKYTSATL